MEGLAVAWHRTGQKFSGWFNALPVKVIHSVLCGIFILWSVYSAAQIVYSLLPASPMQPDLQLTGPDGEALASTVIETGQVDLAQLHSFNVFGLVGDVTDNAIVVSAIDQAEATASKTKLNLALEGIVLASNEGEGLAIIVYQGKQDRYYLGDPLPVGGRVKLARLMLDHVIIDNAGNYESLWLYDESKPRTTSSNSRKATKATAQSAGPKIITDKRSDKSATSLAKNYRRQLYKNPASLSQALRISPKQVNGELVGYKVSPGKDRKQFAALGFKPNDIVTSVNGITLDAPSNALEIYKLMRTASEASFSVDRGGEPVEIMVSLGQPGEEE